MRSYVAVYAVFVATALLLGGCKTTSTKPPTPTVETQCEHPCKPGAMISCYMAQKLVGTCK